MAGRANIVLDRLVYYDDDTVVGEFILLPFNTVVIHNIAVEIQCVFHVGYAKRTGTHKDASAIMYNKHETLLQENYHAQANEKLIYSFGFHIPRGLPPTMAYNREVVKGLVGEYTGSVSWEVCVRADVEGVDTLLLRKRFIKSTLYRLPLDIDNIGIVSYNTMSVDDKDIYIRAALGKRIYTKGEKIKVKVTLENDTALPVVEITCSCLVEVAHGMAKKSLGSTRRDIYCDSSAFQKGLPLAPGGKMETDVWVQPRNTKILRHSAMLTVDEAEWNADMWDQNSALLVPSYFSDADDETSKLRIEYIVRVSATLGKGRKTQKVSVELPFVMSDSKPPEIFVPDMCFETPPAQLYTLHGDGGILCAPMGGAGGGSPAILRRKNSKSMNYLKRLSRSASDLL